MLERCAAALEARGISVSADRAGNVLATVGDGNPRILFDGHADTVAPNPGWTLDPYVARRQGGRLHGLGACDMKGPIAALICGVGDAVGADSVGGTVGVSISTLEEVLEGATLTAAVEAFEPDLVVIAEPSECRLMLAQRGRAELIIDVVGRGAHAAFPERGASALEAAADVLRALRDRSVPEDPRLGRGILVATEATTAPLPGVSVVPSSARIRLDRRTLPGESAEEVLDELRPALEAARAHGARATATLAGGSVRTHTGVTIDEPRFLPAWRTESDQPLVAAAALSLDSALGPVARSHYGFCTNGSLTAGRLGIPTVGFGPGDPEMAHQPDEWIALEQLGVGRRGFAALASTNSPRGGR